MEQPKLHPAQTALIYKLLLKEGNTSTAGLEKISKELSENGEVITTDAATKLWLGGIRNFLEVSDVAGGVGIVRISLSPAIWGSCYLTGRAESHLDHASRELEQCQAAYDSANKASQFARGLLPTDHDHDSDMYIVASTVAVEGEVKGALTRTRDHYRVSEGLQAAKEEYYKLLRCDALRCATIAKIVEGTDWRL